MQGVIKKQVKESPELDEGMPGGMIAAYLKAQDAWCSARDADCAFDGFGPGSIKPAIFAICLAERSRNRAYALNSWADCQTKNNCEWPVTVYAFEVPSDVADSSERPDASPRPPSSAH
jgi:hypothetical protein